MTQPTQAERLWVERIKEGDSDAWAELIARYEGRLFAFLEPRLADRDAAEDLVQETFMGFLLSLPHYRADQSLESYLFSIAVHKLTDFLRRHKRRAKLPRIREGENDLLLELPAGEPAASSMLRSRERRDYEEQALVEALREQIAAWQARGDWEKLECIELMLVRGWRNKEVAERLGLSEQSVANYKFEFISKMQRLLRQQNLPEDLFPELTEGKDTG